MDKNEFISTLIVMGYSNTTNHSYEKGKDRILLYVNSVSITLNGISSFHKTYDKALERLTRE